MKNEKKLHSVCFLSTFIILALIIFPCPVLISAAQSTSSTSVYTYVPSYSNNTLSVIDTSLGAVIGTIPVGIKPIGVLINPDRTKAYVVNTGSGTISVIDTLTNNVTKTLPVGSNPRGIAISPDGKNVYVGDDQDNHIYKIDAVKNKVTSKFPVGLSPHCGVVVSLDGKSIFVTNILEDTVSKINITSERVESQIHVGNNPFGIAVGSNGMVYVANTGSNTVSVFKENQYPIARIKVGYRPQGVAVSPDGTKLYVANNWNRSVSIVDTATNTVIATVDVGIDLFGVLVASDGSRVYALPSCKDITSLINNDTKLIGNDTKKAQHTIKNSYLSTATIAEKYNLNQKVILKIIGAIILLIGIFRLKDIIKHIILFFKSIIFKVSISLEESMDYKSDLIKIIPIFFVIILILPTIYFIFHWLGQKPSTNLDGIISGVIVAGVGALLLKILNDLLNKLKQSKE